MGKICSYINVENCKTLINDLVTFLLDHCNALYYSLPDFALSRKQRVQNTSDSLCFLCQKIASHNSFLMKITLITVHFRVLPKILWHVFKMVNGVLPLYLDDLICKHKPSRSLRSSDANLISCRSYLFQIC